MTGIRVFNHLSKTVAEAEESFQIVISAIQLTLVEDIPPM